MGATMNAESLDSYKSCYEKGIGGLFAPDTAIPKRLAVLSTFHFTEREVAPIFCAQ